MLFTIFCIDKPGVTEKRAAAMPGHVKYLEQSAIKNVMSGPLMDDAMENVVGSLYVVDAPDRAAVEAFQKDDPLVQADIWESIEVRAFNKRVDNRN